MATIQTILNVTIPCGSFPCDVKIECSGKQNYTTTNGTRPWQLLIYWDSNLVNYAGGAGAYSDVVLCQAGVTGQTGDHNLLITWYGDAVIQFRGVNTFVTLQKK